MKTANPDFKSLVERCFSEAAFVADIGAVAAHDAILG